MSYEHRTDESVQFDSFINFANENESDMQKVEQKSTTGFNTLARYFATGYCGDPIALKTGLNGVPSLWIFGKPYKRGR